MGEHRTVRNADAQSRRGARITQAPQRVCRVLPDVTAVERAFDYLVPDHLGPDVRVGAVVRVVLHGRRVRGWVVADDVASTVDATRLLSLLSVSSVGPPAPVVELCELMAHRYSGPLSALLRGATPPNNVAAQTVRVNHSQRISDRIPPPSDDLDRRVDALDLEAVSYGLTVVRWPPNTDRRRLVARMLSDAGSSLVITADGARARAFGQWLAAMGVRVVVLHSDLAPAELTTNWRVAAGGNCVVVGGRMAAFAPMPDLARVIVLDDADEALQEERSPTWHAREVVLERAELAGVRSYIVSPVPTAVALRRASAVVEVPRGVEVQGWPRVEIIDLRASDPAAGLVSDELVATIRSVMQRDELAILVLNRRGGVRLLRCATCHSLSRWDANGAPMWAHDAPADADVKPSFCAACGGTKLSVVSAGIQRVGSQLSARLGGIDVAIVDANVETVPDASVVIGTEAVLHRRELRSRRPALVAFIDFDAELYAPRYRANEQAMWLIVRAAHLLALRARGDARVVIQTHEPFHEVVVAARDAQPEILTQAELERRELYDMPPFAAIAEIRGDHDAISACAHSLEELLDTMPEARVDRTDDRLLVHAPGGTELAALLSIAVAKGRAVGKLRVAVDPPRI